MLLMLGAGKRSSLFCQIIDEVDEKFCNIGPNTFLKVERKRCSSNVFIFDYFERFFIDDLSYTNIVETL